MGDHFDSLGTKEEHESTVEHPSPTFPYLKDPHNVWGFDRYVVNTYAPVSDGRLSAKQVFTLFSNLFPLSSKEFIRLTSSAMMKEKTVTPMIARAPVYPILHGLSHFRFEMLEASGAIIPSQPEYAAWLLEAQVQPRFSRPHHRSRKHSNVQHVLIHPNYDIGSDLDLWTHILFLPTSSIFFTRFARTVNSSNPPLHIPLPSEWLRIKQLDGQFAKGSFIYQYRLLYKVRPFCAHGTPTVCLGTHHPDFSQGTPFLAPDLYLSLCQGGPTLDLRCLDVEARRHIYRTKLRQSPSRRSLCRQYIQGATFHNPKSTSGVFTITAAMLSSGSFDLHVDVLQANLEVPSIRTCVRVTRCLDTKLLSTGRELANTIPSSSSGVRKNSLQYGVMHSFGTHVYNGVLRKFKETRRQRGALLLFTELLSHYISRSFPLEAAAMTTAERSRGLYPDTSSFSTISTCASLNASVDLGNSDHFDTRDISIGVSLFVTDDPASPVTDWYFVLPNIALEFHGKHYKGVLVELQDGVALSWDGRYIRHCTSAGVTTNPGNRRYGLHMAANGPSAKLSSSDKET
jgi:hypothetical protein